MNANALHTVIVDDSDIDRYMLEELSNKCNQLRVVGCFTHPIEALEFIKAHPPQLLLLDIDMPKATGIDLLKQVRDTVPMAVFITSHPEFALEGFELSALDYILKPISEERFTKMIQKVDEYWEMKQKSLAYDVSIKSDSIIIKQGYEQIPIRISDIIYLEALHDYTKIFIPNKRYVTNINLINFLSKLPTDLFIRVHRSYAVAKNKITKKNADEILLINDRCVPIGKTYRRELKMIF